MDISPDTQSLDRVFSGTTYNIDFYQRDYRWTDQPVLRLLDDVFYKFEDQYGRSKNLDPTLETIMATYPWYYLNTYVTNVVDGKLYVVDGQQRLTTLSLILIKLRHLAILNDSKLATWIATKIAGYAGFELTFWMNHPGSKAVLQALYEGSDTQAADAEAGTTGHNLVRNYNTISAFFDRQIVDKHAFETFVFYFLHRLVLINLTVERTDVPMVFEVINDRGVRLRPYEILKGKLLGQIDKVELTQGAFTDLWEQHTAAINAFKEDEVDEFFRFYLKAQYADTRNEGLRFDGAYHRAMFARDMDGPLGLLHNASGVKAFLRRDFSYYAKLYVKLRWAARGGSTPFRSVHYNELLDLDAPFLLAMSACVIDDPEEDQKIQCVSSEIDRYFSLLQLQGAYDSNEFSESLYPISVAIRGASKGSFRLAFDKQLTDTIAKRRNATEAEPLSYAAFRPTGANLNTRFKRYFFARVDEFLAEHTNMGMKHSVADLVTKTGAVNGFHVEHILARNPQSLAAFGGDEDLFEQERSRLGGILLLKGLDNISSNDEVYAEKLATYANTLYWNESLRRDFYKSSLAVDGLKKTYNLDLVPFDAFGPAELEARHKLLYRLVELIWN